jgi:hypothetical protein
MNFIIGWLFGFASTLVFFRIIDGCWPWDRDRDLFAEEDAARQNQMVPTPDNEMIIKYTPVRGNGGAGGVAEYAAGGGGGMSYAPVVEVQPFDRIEPTPAEEQRFTTEEQLDAGNWPPVDDAKPDPLAR